MRFGRIASICAAISLPLLIVGDPIFADQTDPNAQPPSGGKSLVCTLKFGRRDAQLPAFFTPIDNKTWIGWIWPIERTEYVLEPIQFGVEQNDADGIKLVAVYGPFDVRVFVSTREQRISLVRSMANSSEPEYGGGHCGLLNESEFSLEVEMNNLDWDI